MVPCGRQITVRVAEKELMGVTHLDLTEGFLQSFLDETRESM